MSSKEQLRDITKQFLIDSMPHLRQMHPAEQMGYWSEIIQFANNDVQKILEVVIAEVEKTTIVVPEQEIVLA